MIFGTNNDDLFEGDLLNETAEIADVLIADELMRSLTKRDGRILTIR